MNGSWLPPAPPLLALLFIFGLCLGSFLNVVIHRLPTGLSLLFPPSHCPRCRHLVRPWHNLPLIGWIALRGRCADCGTRIAVRYPLVELAGGGLTVLAAACFPTPCSSLAALWLCLALLAVLFIDLEHRIIPNQISLGGIPLGLALSPWTVGFTAAMAGMAAGAGALFAAGWIYQRLRGRPGMGLGDVKLAAMLGAFLGPKGIALSVLLASFLGSILGLALVARRKGTGATALPFGSLLAPAALVALFWGERIWTWYLGYFPRR